MNYQERFKEIILEHEINDYQDGDNYKFLKEYISKVVKTSAELIKIAKNEITILNYLPESMKKLDIYLEVVKNNGRALTYVPKEMRTPKMCQEAVKNDGRALEDVPQEMRTPEICLEAVKNNGKALIYVPQEMRTPEICLEAVRNNGIALRDVPEEMKTLEMCLEAVKNDGEALIYISEEMKTLEICQEAVKNSGIALEYVPEKMKTLEVCLEALKNDALALIDVPEEMKTLEICQEAVRNKGGALAYVPDEIKTSEMCLEAVKNYGGILHTVPEEMRTPEICLEAVKNYGYALMYVPEKVKTLEICQEAIKNNGLALDDVPRKMRTSEMCLEAVRNNGEALAYVPDEIKTSEICIEAVKNCGEILYMVPEEMRTPEICLEAVKNYGYALMYVPEELRTVDIIIESLKYGKFENFRRIYELAEKADKFNDICHFVPILKVLEKYPESQIEKFNKKIWFSLARNDLFNINIDTKCALVEAVLSLGAFDKDSTQQERIGFIQKMATNIPKEEVFYVDQLDDFIKENFKVIGSTKKIKDYHLNKERLLSDPNIKNLFGIKDKASKIIEGLQENISPERISQILNSEEENDDYRKVLEYIYKTGYDKVEETEYAVKLARDIQKEKIKDRRKGLELENKIREFYYSHDSRLIMTPEKFHRIFDGMDMQYKPGFYEFFKDNYEQILSDDKKQSKLSRIQRQWDKIVEANLGQKINFEKCELYLLNHNYENVGEDELEIAKLASNCGYSQEDFKKIQEIFAAQRARTKSSIPQIEKKDKKTGYTYKVLRLDDPTTIFVGELTDCCQALGGAGESCMRHSATSPNGRVLVVDDENGKILSQSWIWRNKNTLCFDNIEAVKKDSNNKKIISSDLLSVIRGAAKDFVEADKIGVEKWKQEQLASLERKKESNEITEREYNQEKDRIERIVEGQRLTKVTVGIGYTDVDLSGLKGDNENKYPEETVSYISDSRTQLILYEDTSANHQESQERTVAMYSDSESSTKLIDIDTSEITRSDNGDEDEYENNDEEESFGLHDIKETIRNAQNRSEARKALQNIEKWLEENSVEM